ncbi:hypothetical protein I4U23_031319 [Adineta vaga]|nr:hypothetical protein I4U23_031319 [Adineta vaga]
MFTNPLTYGFDLPICVLCNNVEQESDWTLDYKYNTQIFKFDEELSVRSMHSIVDHYAACHRLFWTRKLYARYFNVEYMPSKKEFNEIFAN